MNEICLSAEIGCPSCGGRFVAVWTSGSPEAGQRCPSGHRFTAAWPGFTFRPETVTVARPAAAA